MNENMPLLLTESLDPARRELTHAHIEHCAVCTAEWEAYRDTWRLMGELPEVEVPARAREKFLAAAFPVEAAPNRDNVVPFVRRPAFKWVAQAAAVAVIAGGSYLAGHRTSTVEYHTADRPAIQAAPSNVQPISYSIAENRVLDSQSMSPDIQGRPDIQNVRFLDDNPNDDKFGVEFDITSHVSVSGKRTDKSMVRLLSYVLQNEDRMSPSSSRAIDWVRTTYSDPSKIDPEIAKALANVLVNDSHEGVRIKAAETLQRMPESAPETRVALIEALKSDPNPAVRIKAVEALAAMARSGVSLDNATVDTLRKKASQGDENTYVRVKAAEALSNVRP
jgi:hypothetical protein